MEIPEEYKSTVKTLENWITTEEHLPQNILFDLLMRFVVVCQGDLENTKKLLENNFTFRSKYPKIFFERDPLTEGTKKVWEIADIIVLPGLTPDLGKVTFCYIRDLPDLSVYNPEEWVKTYLMMADARFITPDPAGYTVYDVILFDMSTVTVQLLRTWPLKLLWMFMKFNQDFQSNILKEIHLLNCPTYISPIMAILRPFLKKEIQNKFYYHNPNSETLFDFVPKKMMPTEFGGEAGSINDLKTELIKNLESQREYVMDVTRWKIKEELRKKKVNSYYFF